MRRLGQALDRALDPRLLQTFERMVERSTRQMEKLVSVTDRMGRAAEAIARSQTGGGRAAVAVGAGAAAGSYLGTRAAQRQSGPGFFRRQHMRAQALGGAAARYAPVSEGWMSQALNGIPYIGPLLGSTLAGAQQYYQQWAAYQQTLASTMGQTGGASTIGRGGRLGIQFGIGLPQQAQMMAQFAGQSGRSGRSLQSIGPQLMAMQRVMGIQNAGSILGAFETAGGQSDGAQLRDIIAAGMEMGVRTARLDQYLQITASFAEQARSQGMLINADSMSSLFRVIGSSPVLSDPRSGWTGRAGAQAMTNIAGALRNAPQGQGMFSMLALRAAGYTGREGGQSLMQAQMALEERPHEVIPELFRMMIARGGSREGTAFAIQQIMREGGVNLSTRQVLSLSAGGLSGVDFYADMGPERGRELLRNQEASRRRQMAPALAGAAHGAGLEAQRIAIGGSENVRRGVQQIQNLEIGLVRQFLPSAMRLVRGVAGAATEIMEAYNSGGWGAALRAATQIFAANALDFVPEEMRGEVQGYGEGASDAASGLRRLMNDPNAQLGVTGYDSIDSAITSGVRLVAPVYEPIFQGFADATGADDTPPPPSSDAVGPQSSLGDVLRRSGRLQLQAADLADQMGLPTENMLETAVG